MVLWTGINRIAPLPTLRRTRCEESTNGSALEPPKKLHQEETFDEKLFRKFKKEPLIPIGCCVTVYFLVSGVKSFLDRDTLRSQKMMRGRVVAQLATIMCFAFYTGWENLDFRLAPLTQDIPEWEKKLEELQQAQQQDQEEGREKK